MPEEFKYKYDDLFNPVIKALHELGGSGSVGEIEEKVALILRLTDAQVNDIHRGNETKLNYRLRWARNYLKRYGLLENSSRGVWALTGKGNKTKHVDKDVINSFHTQQRLVSKKLAVDFQILGELEENAEIEKLTWQEQIIEELKQIHPSAFERVCQRLLRELGFQNVEVTGKSNDGGVDGRGLLKLGGVLSFHVFFQAKRFKNTVTPAIVREFRGAMAGRGDKGLIITTGTFTREAKREASRDGAVPIDLIDGNDLAEKLKELKIGVEVELVEKVNVKKEWFQTI